MRTGQRTSCTAKQRLQRSVAQVRPCGVLTAVLLLALPVSTEPRVVTAACVLLLSCMNIFMHAYGSPIAYYMKKGSFSNLQASCCNFQMLTNLCLHVNFDNLRSNCVVRLHARFHHLSGLRDILLRTTSIKDLPTDIWTATNPMTCAAGPAGGIANLQGSTSAGAGGARNKLVLPALLGGTAALQIDPGSEPGWVKVTLSSSSSSSSGWLGFGVADPG